MQPSYQSKAEEAQAGAAMACMQTYSQSPSIAMATGPSGKNYFHQEFAVFSRACAHTHTHTHTVFLEMLVFLTFKGISFGME